MELNINVLKEISERNKYGESIVNLSKEYGFNKQKIYKELKKNNLNNNGRRYNKYDLNGDFGIGYATNTEDIFYFDLEDYDKIKDICWYLSFKPDGNKYMDNKNGSYKTMSRFILDAKKNEYIDHIDGNTLDNRKLNLRPCTNQQNGFNCKLSKNNKSGISGVCWDKSKNLWIASIKYNYKDIYIKGCKNKEDAIKARLKKEKELFGEFSGQKHLFKKYGIGDKNE